MFENVTGRMDNGRRTDAGSLVCFKLTGELSARVSYKYTTAMLHNKLHPLPALYGILPNSYESDCHETFTIC